MYQKINFCQIKRRQKAKNGCYCGFLLFHVIDAKKQPTKTLLIIKNEISLSFPYYLIEITMKAKHFLLNCKDLIEF